MCLPASPLGPFNKQLHGNQRFTLAKRFVGNISAKLSSVTWRQEKGGGSRLCSCVCELVSRSAGIMVGWGTVQ